MRRGYLDKMVEAALQEATGAAPPKGPAATAVISMPVLSPEVAMALESADELAAAAGFSVVQTTHLAMGGLRQRDSPVVTALLDVGVTLGDVEDIVGRAASDPPESVAGRRLRRHCARAGPRTRPECRSVGRRSRCREGRAASARYSAAVGGGPVRGLGQRQELLHGADAGA